MFIIAILLLTGCGGADKEYRMKTKEAERRLEESKKKTEELQKLTEQIDETSDMLSELADAVGLEVETIDLNELREDIEYAVLGENDTLIDLSLDDGEIIAVIEIGDNIFDDDILVAESLYSNAGDIIFDYDGWDVLTIEFVDIGKISLNKYDGEINEYDMKYFPFEKIIGQLD